MKFATVSVTALSFGSSALAQSQMQTTVHVVRVGSMNNSKAYFPNKISAAAGDMVQFQFASGNHTVTQSTFDAPCMPISMMSKEAGFYSGFMPVTTDSTTAPTYTVMINNTSPIWVYCSQAKECQKGMTMVINEDTTANNTRSLANYVALASKATVNLPGDAVMGDKATGSGKGMASPTGTGFSSGSASAPGSASDSALAPKPTSSASTLSVGFCAIFAAGISLVL